MKFRLPKPADRLPIKDDFIFNLISNAISNGEDAEFFYRFVDRYDGDYRDKHRYKVMVSKWLSAKDVKVQLEENLVLDGEANIAGRRLNLFD